MTDILIVEDDKELADLSRFFGRFTWGVNLLRESIEDSRKKEITMQSACKI